MRICVFGLWHLGCVTAACLANRGFKVVGLDDEDKIRELKNGKPPIFEPGLEELIKNGMENETLHFTDDASMALHDADVLWATFDTPVDDNDDADVEYVMDKVRSVFQYIRPRTLVIISSQVNVGTTRSLQEEYDEEYPDTIPFIYIPENLRLGKAIQSFEYPERIIIGTDEDIDAEYEDNNIQKIEDLAGGFNNIIWMSIESAEMTKHALNVWLATSIVFANEVAEICECVGADYKDVESGLRTDPRVGMKAYIRAGNAYAGGTLARDVGFLQAAAANNKIKDSILFNAVEKSNNEHKMWVVNKLDDTVGINRKTITVLGLTYKSGTDTLRRSHSLKLCMLLWRRGAGVKCYDPLVKEIPDGYEDIITMSSSVIEAITGADAVVIMNDCDEYRALCIADVGCPVVIDPNGFLEDILGHKEMVEYYTVGGYMAKYDKNKRKP